MEVGKLGLRRRLDRLNRFLATPALWQKRTVLIKRSMSAFRSSSDIAAHYCDSSGLNHGEVAPPMKLVEHVRLNPLGYWWATMSLASSGNILLWLLLYSHMSTVAAAGAFDVKLMLILCAAYVFGCAFRSLLPRADLQRICLFDTWLSSVLIGRSVATVAEVCFATQWAIVLHRLGSMAGADFSAGVALLVVPLIILAQVFCWYGVVTTNPLANAMENSIWALTFFFVGFGLSSLLPEVDGLLRFALVIAIIGIAAYLAFLIRIDIPMYLRRWQSGRANGRVHLGPIDGLRDIALRRTVSRDFAQWKDEIVWMSLYFTTAVWASLALCVVYLAHR
jgi:hypothetical protein